VRKNRLAKVRSELVKEQEIANIEGKSTIMFQPFGLTEGLKATNSK
jgi:hypothetical protein